MTKVRNCYKCNSKFNFFRWRKECEECAKIFCSNCINEFPKKHDYEKYLLDFPFSDRMKSYKKGYLCNYCWSKLFKSEVEEFDSNYRYIISNLEIIECYPKTYKGKIKINNKVKPIQLESNYNKDKDDSIAELKITTYIKGLDVVYELNWLSKKEEDGNYIYKVWKATAKAAKLLKNNV
jgi:hypothetical protein